MKTAYPEKAQIKEAARILQETYFNSLAQAEAYLIDKSKTKECFVAIEKGKVMGVLAYSRDYPHYANYISDIAVHEDHRRKSVATELIRKFIKISRKEQPQKQKYALSSTDQTNKASIKMHLKLGFKKIGRIKGLHYGKDEIIFGYRLR